MDVWRLDSSRRLVVRSSEDFNKFCLISTGTGQSTKAMEGQEIFDYLVKGKNPIGAYFVKEFNLEEKLKALPNYGSFPSFWVWDEDITDEKLLKMREYEESRYNNLPPTP